MPTRPMKHIASLVTATIVAISALLTSVAQAQRDLKDIPPPDPELERQTFVLPEGFEVNLFAGDPQIAKPIQMNFDPQGRLWVCSSSTYPQVAPGDEADDRILILEDTDGDGVCDKTTVFAEGLLIPTGIAPGDGGVYVANSTELLHLTDTDGDGKADSRRVVLSGFGTEDTHHILHTFRWGPAQRLHLLQSIYIHSHIETPFGVKRLNAGGIWRFDPSTWELEVFARGWVNPWGLHWLPEGQTFTTDGAGSEGINYAVPDAFYATAYGAPRILRGLNPGSPKHCGLEVVTGRHLPDDWQQSFITCDFRGHRVCRFTLKEDGSGYRSQEQQEVIKSDHVAFRPIDVKMGPAGAIYIADWYNPIIQHGEVDFRDSRRDHTHGRIWRVTYPGRQLVDRPALVDATDAQLCTHLADPEMWTREQTKRLLKERGPQVLDAVKQWARQLDNTEPLYQQRRLEALRVYQSFDEVEQELLLSLLRCDDHNVRAAATRVLREWHDRMDNVLDLLEPLVGDEHARVRLEAVCALRDIRDPRSIELAMRALDPAIDPRSARDAWQLSDPKTATPPESPVVDEWLEYALWQTARDLQPVWEPALLANEIDFGGDVSQLAFVLRSAGSAETVPVLTKLLREGAVPESERENALAVIGQYAGPPQLGQLLTLATVTDDEVLTSSCLKTLLRVSQQRKLVPAGDLTSIGQLLTDGTADIRTVAARCVGAWKVASLRPTLETIVTDDSLGDGVREAAIDGIASFGGKEAATLLIKLTRKEQPLNLRQTASIALLGLRPPAGVNGAIALMQEAESAESLTPLFDAFLRRKGARDRLTTELDKQTISADAAIVGLRAIGSSGQPLPQFSAALQKAGGITTGLKKLTPEEMTSLVAQIEADGDPAAGEQVYRRRDLNCLQCHAIGGAGGKVGPDMISLGATAQYDYIVNALLDPNAQVKEGFHTMIVLDDDGRTFSGIVVRQTDDELLLRDAEGREQSVPLDSIEQQKQGVSLMPAGLTDKLTRSDLIHLAAFLKALGRLPEYTIGKTPLLRSWEVMQPTKEAAHRLRRVSYAASATDDPSFRWLPLYANVAGNVPLSDLPIVSVKNRSAPGSRGVAFIRTTVDAATVQQLRFGDTTGLAAWWDDRPLELAESVTLPSMADQHRLTLAVDLSERTSPLRIELSTE